jgi:hypothetical protein
MVLRLEAARGDFGLLFVFVSMLFNEAVVSEINLPH